MSWKCSVVHHLISVCSVLHCGWKEQKRRNIMLNYSYTFPTHTTWNACKCVVCGPMSSWRKTFINATDQAQQWTRPFNVDGSTLPIRTAMYVNQRGRSFGNKSKKASTSTWDKENILPRMTHALLLPRTSWIILPAISRDGALIEKFGFTFWNKRIHWETTQS